MTKTIIIDGKETHYTISDKGEVFNEKTGKVLKGTYARNEYHTVQLTIDGKPIANRCNVTDLKSFSGHMQLIDMLKYYSDINYEKIALVHGDFNPKCEFGKVLQDEIYKKNRTGKVICVNNLTEILL